MDFKPLKSLEVYLKSLVEARLWVKVLVAMVLGVGAGVALGPGAGWVPEHTTVSIGNWLALPGQLFMKLVQMIMIPLIFASIITGIVSTSTEQLKKMGVGVGVYFIATTTVSIALGVLLAVAIEPGAYFEGKSSVEQVEVVASPEGTIEQPAFKNIPNAISELLPENPLASMVSGEMLAIVIFTIIIGVAVVQLSNSMKEPIMRLLSAIQEICMTIVKWAMRLVPYAVFGLIAQLVASIGISSLKGIGLYVATVLVGLLILLIIYMVIVGTFGRQNPFAFLKKIREVQLLAFSTTSSAAVMPLSIKTAQDELGVSKSVSNFLIPVGATVNMDGTAIYQCISALFIAQAYGLEMSMASIVPIMFTIVAASIGTPSIPGGGVIILASVLQGAGIPTEGIVIIIGVERILGMFRTAINVTGDLTACIVFNRMEQKWNRSTIPK
jgi:Na+/H+-dicarboxylate symporter